MPEIRAVSAADAPLLREVRLRALTESPDAFASSAEEEAALGDAEWLRRAAEGEDDAVAFLALDGGRPVGMTGAYWHDRARGIVSVWGMWVDPDWRGTGVGRDLVGAVRDWAGTREGRFVRLGVLEGPGDATGFYERLGFVRTGEERPYRRDPSRWAFWMARPV